MKNGAWANIPPKSNRDDPVWSPPVPAFYADPKSLDEMVDHTPGRVLDLFDIDLGLVRRWTGDRPRVKNATLRD